MKANSMDALNSTRSKASVPALFHVFGRHHRIGGLILALLLCAAPIHADEPTPFLWPAHRSIPARISDGAVVANLALDGWYAFRHEDHAERWQYVCRVGLTAGVAEVLKRVFDRERPNGYDRKSTPSAHTMHSVASAGYRSPLGASLALTVAWGRTASGWHYGTDVAFGAGLGYVIGKACDRL